MSSISPTSSGSRTSPGISTDTSKSSRVCLNCRRKKKRCDKVLPSCGRCTNSLEVCKQEDDPNSSSWSSPSSHNQIVEIFAEKWPHVASISMPGLDPVIENLMGQQTWSRLNSSHFQVPGLGGDIHPFMLRSLKHIVQDRQAVEHVISCYFNGANTWFTIVEKTSLETQVEKLWTPGYPSAEIALLVLSMLLVIRIPSEAEAEMDDGLYQSVKTMCTLVETRLPWSTTLLQSRLLISLYELSQGLPQQAYLSVGSCVQITKEFGWHYQSFWSEERQQTLPAELKLSSLLWWALVYVDNLLTVSYPERKQSLSTTQLSFQIPFPEAFNQYLGNSVDSTSPESVTDRHNDRIEGIVWPEATSAWYLSTFLHKLHDPFESLTPADRERLSDALSVHTMSTMTGDWRYGSRCATTTMNFITLMKINQPSLAARMNNPTELDLRALNYVKSAIDSMFIITEITNNSPSIQRLYPTPITAMFCLYYGGMLLIAHGDNVLEDPQWLPKLESFQTLLKMCTNRWRIAAKYLTSMKLALNARLSQHKEVAGEPA